VAPFAGAERFAAELETRGIRRGFLAVPGAVHLFDLSVRPGTTEWEERVAPGYKFLIEAVRGVRCKR